jgi:hypothetical protein
MIGPIRDTGKKGVDSFHHTLINAINFTKSKAYSPAIDRLKLLGITQEEADTLLNPPTKTLKYIMGFPLAKVFMRSRE